MYGYQSGKGGGINLEFRVNRYILLYERRINKKDLLKTSLVVQWLELHTPNAGTQVQSHLPLLNVPHATTKAPAWPST